MQHFYEARERTTYLLVQEDVCWRQRAKVNLLKDGDTNSKFFHALTRKLWNLRTSSVE